MKIILDAMGGDFAPEAPVMGAIDAVKAYGAQIVLVGRGDEILNVLKKNGIDPKDVFVVSIMPCTAKKYEATRDQLKTEGLADVDAVLTTRELGKLIKRSGINFTRLPDEEFDTDLVGQYTPAAPIGAMKNL